MVSTYKYIPQPTNSINPINQRGACTPPPTFTSDRMQYTQCNAMSSVNHFSKGSNAMFTRTVAIMMISASSTHVISDICSINYEDMKKIIARLNKQTALCGTQKDDREKAE